MKRIPEHDPRKNIRRLQPSHTSQDMDGFGGLGMKKDALALARRVLRSKSVSAKEFENALDAILTHADRCKPWKTLVESAYARLSRRDQKAVRFLMLSFCASSGFYEDASRFIPQRFDGAFGLLEMVFAVHTALATGETALAKKLTKLLPRAIKEAPHPMMKSLLFEALGESQARDGKWDEAIASWEAAQCDGTISQNAVMNIVEIHAARALRTLQRGFQLIEKFNQDFDPELETVVPGTAKAIQRDAEKQFRRLQKILEKIAPKERRKELGI
jgi:hypothetical protein